MVAKVHNRRAEDNAKVAIEKASPMSDLAQTEQKILHLKTQIAELNDDIARYQNNLIVANNLVDELNNELRYHTTRFRHLTQKLHNSEGYTAVPIPTDLNELL